MEGRVTRLEADMREVKQDVKKILTNHLPHIKMQISVLIAQQVIIMAAVAYLIFG